MAPLVSDVLELLEIPSVGGTAGEQQAQQWVATKLREWGWDVEVWVDDPLTYLEDPDYPGMEVVRAAVTGVIGRPPGSNGTRLILGHTDVVPGGPAPALIGDDLTGRGSVDMKAGLVAGMHAARAAGGDVAVCAVSGEEDGGIGTFLALRHGLTARECVIPEPTGLAVIPANAGSLTFRISLHGEAAHGAMPWDGRNALDELPAVLHRLRDLQSARNQDVPEVLAAWPLAFPISIGRIDGGDWPSTVMAHVHLEGRYGVRLDESLQTAAHVFEEALAGSGAEVSWFGGRFAAAALEAGHPLVGHLSAAHRRVVGADPAVVGATYGSDLRQMLAAGIPTVQYGPGDVRLAHSSTESVPLEQVRRCRDVLEAWLRGPSILDR